MPDLSFPLGLIGGGIIPIVYNFDEFSITGTGPYTLSTTPAAAGIFNVYVDGLLQKKSDYTLSVNQVTLSVGAATGSLFLQVVYT